VTVVDPTMRLERRLLREHAAVISLDEVGRGAVAGPVAVGVTVLSAVGARRRIPEGLRDSKSVPAVHRPAVAVRARDWVDASAVGWAGADEIDAMGIMRALGVAAHRALACLREEGAIPPDAIIVLDGNVDYITPASPPPAPVLTRVAADRDCAGTAAASVIAKTQRDALMVALAPDFPPYAWERNKGYASAEHRRAIGRIGLSVHHRASWAILPGGPDC
jgi:ribonuclease HII